MRCNKSSAGRSRGPANFRYCAGSQGISELSDRVEGGGAGTQTPAVRFDPGALIKIAELPTGKAAPRQRGAGPGIKPRPWHKRAAPAVSPDLDPQRAGG